MEWAKNFWYLNKNTIASVLSGLLLFIVNIFYPFFNENFIEDNFSIFVSLDIALIGVIFTVLTLYMGLPLSEKLNERIQKFQYDKIITRCLGLAILFFFTTLFLFIFNQNSNFAINKISFCIMITALLQTLQGIYYIFILSLHSKKKQ